MFYILFLLVALSSDSDIYMLETGATLNKLDFKHILYHTFIFAFTDIIMIFLGLNIGQFIIDQTMLIVHEVITVIAMLAISAILFVKTYKRHGFEEHRSNGFDLKTSYKQAIITGIDTLLIGIGISSFGYSQWLIYLLVFALNMMSSLSAVIIGYYMGARFQRIFGYISAFVYFVIANIELILMVI